MLRGFANTLLQVSTVGLVVLVLGSIGFDVIWNAAKDIFPSWGSFFTFLLVMTGLSGLIYAWKNH